ncbi:MAG: hypothetical protein GX220_05520 [Treponema sp.]|jgi:hypothetical protein|nr:hypothetical protein [Treponema sp.]
MKKIILVLLIFNFICFFVFAQEIEVIQEKDKLVSMTIEFLPSLDEARFIYTCPAGLFEHGEAMKVIKERAANFTRERGYFFYTYLRPDVTRYDNEKKLASYTAFIKFLD